MKKLTFLFLAVAFWSCKLFPESIGKVDKSPKHKVRLNGTFIREVNEGYWLFSKLSCDNKPEVYKDTLTLDGTVYHQVFFAKIIPEKLDKDYKNLDLAPCSPSIDVYAKNDTLRKQVPGFGDREFLVMENVVGVQ